MAGYIKQIVLILLAINMGLFFVGLYDFGSDSSSLFNTFGMDYNSTDGSLGVEDANGDENWLSNLLGLVAIGAVGITIASVFISDISGIIRIGMVSLLIPLVVLPIATIMSLDGLPSEFKLMFGGIMTIMFVFGLVDFFGGVDS